MTDKPFPVPTIHSNGTSREQLLDQVCQAHFAVIKAVEALERAAPNGRDYYPQGNSALKLATEAHHARVVKLVDVLVELARLAEEIADAP